MSVEAGWFGMRESRYTHLISDACSCHVLWVLAVAVCKIGDVCCWPAPAHQPFSSNSLDFSAPEEANSRSVRVSGTLKFGYECVFKITTHVPCVFDSQIHILEMDVWCGPCECKLGMQHWLQSHWKWNFPVLGKGTETWQKL